MPVLFAVLDDLFRFALHSLFGFVTVLEKHKSVDELSAPLQPLLPLLPSARSYVPPHTELVSAQGTYFVGVSESALRLDPVAAYDNVIATLTYGSQVTVLKYGGRWAMVQTKDHNGWLLKDDINSSVAEVLPVFLMGSAYDAEHDTTKKVRLLIRDTFACAEPALPLTGPEYVIYRLLRAQRTINWSSQRPRLPGQWQQLLRGAPRIHMGVVPKTGTVMEFIDGEEGKLLYVEAVFPDESIQVSAVDYDGQGVYSENILPKEVWRELRPVFIEVL